MAKKAAGRGQEETGADDPSVAPAAMLPLLMSDAGQLSHALMEIEMLVVRVDGARRVGDEDRALTLLEEAQRIACTAMDLAVESYQIPEPISTFLGEHSADVDAFLTSGSDLRIGGADNDSPLSRGDFDNAEIALLRLAGLSGGLAQSHLRAARENYRPIEIPATREYLLSKLHDAKEAVCEALELSLQSRKRRENLGWRRQILRLSSFTAGGTLLAVVNGLAAPTGVALPITAASTVLGSGAAGGVVNLFERMFDQG